MNLIILNIKQLALKLNDVESTKIYIKANGPKVISAGDIDCGAHVEVLNKEEHKPKIIIEKVTPETELMKMLKENGITKKMLVKNKSRFSPVLHNYYKEANIKEGFNVFLSKVLKRLD